MAQGGGYGTFGMSGARGPSPAGTLLIEDALKKIIYRDGCKSLRVEKQRGLGSSCWPYRKGGDSGNPRVVV